jgi:hypothetical protein
MSTLGEEEEGNKLTGSWKQVVNFFSIGDATVHRQPLADTAYQFLQFNKDSTFESNISSLAAYKSYSVLNDSSIRFSGENVQPVVNQYELSGDTLHLFMQCIEACGGSFVPEVQ